MQSSVASILFKKNKVETNILRNLANFLKKMFLYHTGTVAFIGLRKINTSSALGFTQIPYQHVTDQNILKKSVTKTMVYKSKYRSHGFSLHL